MSNSTKFPPEEFTSLEKERLEEFQKLCVNLELTKEQKKDAQLMRWLRARDLDVKKAFKMLEQHLVWRREKQIDGIIERETFPPELLRAQRVAYLGVDNQGCPILLACFGIQDTRAIIEQYGEEMITRLTYVNMEKLVELLRKASQEQGREVTQVVEIMDMEGYSFRQFTSKRCVDFMGKVQKELDDNYPEIIRLMIGINAPKVFHVAFKLFKPFMSKRTLDKIDIYGSDRKMWEKVLQEKFPMELIPKHWGGTREGSDEFCSQDDIWINSRVSLEDFAGLTSICMDEDTTPATINARDTLKIPVEVKTTGSTILCGIRVENYDIGFQILDPTDKPVEPLKRISASKTAHETSVEASVIGTYTLHFDNSYSLTRSKTIHYSVSVFNSEC